jgi:hypothetical protein
MGICNLANFLAGHVADLLPAICEAAIIRLVLEKTTKYLDLG